MCFLITCSGMSFESFTKTNSYNFKTMLLFKDMLLRLKFVAPARSPIALTFDALLFLASGYRVFRKVFSQKKTLVIVAPMN